MTDLKVVPLPPPTDATGDLIAVLEAAIERVKEGDLESFVMVSVMRGGGAVSARHAPVEINRYALLGAISKEVHDLHLLIDSDNLRQNIFTPDGAA